MAAFYKSVDEFYSAKRARKASRRRARIERTAERGRLWRLQVQKSFGPRSKIISLLAARASKHQEIIPQKYSASVHIPKTFSTIDDPRGALSVAIGFAAVLQKNERIRRVRIDHSRLEVFDLAAEALLDLVAVELKTQIRTRSARKHLRVTGAYPRSAAVKRFIKAAGIIQQMDIRHELPTDKETEPLRIFHARNRHYMQNVDPRTADLKDRESAKFIDHIDRCLRDHGRSLSPFGKQKLGEYLGEILSNAEEHAGFMDWTIKGYLDNSLKQSVCEIAIINFGSSIAETLSAVTPGGYTAKMINGYLSIHEKNGWFSPSWRREDLLTVIALQANVSRLNQNSTDSRGQGTVDLIEFFQRVHAECGRDGAKAEMAIISGSTFIGFDGKYRLQKNDNGVKVIAFNSENSLEHPPDRNYVKSLGNFVFPGTIISIRFPLSLAESGMVEDIADE